MVRDISEQSEIIFNGAPLSFPTGPSCSKDFRVHRKYLSLVQ